METLNSMPQDFLSSMMTVGIPLLSTEMTTETSIRYWWRTCRSGIGFKFHVLSLLALGRPTFTVQTLGVQNMWAVRFV